ncbi:MAG: hypothetical protein MHMPM18_000495 [Marteilia pararefringens]
MFFKAFLISLLLVNNTLSLAKGVKPTVETISQAVKSKSTDDLSKANSSDVEKKSTATKSKEDSLEDIIGQALMNSSNEYADKMQNIINMTCMKCSDISMSMAGSNPPFDIEDLSDEEILEQREEYHEGMGMCNDCFEYFFIRSVSKRQAAFVGHKITNKFTKKSVDTNHVRDFLFPAKVAGHRTIYNPGNNTKEIYIINPQTEAIMHKRIPIINELLKTFTGKNCEIVYGQN